LTKEDADVAIADIMNRIKSLEAAVNPEQMQSLQESVNAVEVQMMISSRDYLYLKSTRI